MRHISFSMTTQQVRERSKDVTRRDGWCGAKAGDLLRGVEKAMGLKRGERVVPLCVIRVLSVRREPLSVLVADAEYGRSEMVREGFPGLDPAEFVRRFAERGIPEHRAVTRIEFEYVDGEDGNG